jgi:hypothetical protein
MNHIEAMKSWLKVLMGVWSGGFMFPTTEDQIKAITTLQTAIEAAQSRSDVEKQEPVAWMHEGWITGVGPVIRFDHHLDADKNHDGWTPLYTTPPNVATPQAAPVQEPPDDELTQALIERDETENTANELAQAIAQITGEDIGEHTSANFPWRNALDAAENWLCHPPAAQKRIEELEAELMRMQGRELKLQMALKTPAAPVQEQPVLIPASLADTQFERYYRQGYDAGIAAQPAPVQEPVGWFKYDKVSGCWHPQHDEFAPTHAVREGWKQLYTTPPAAQPAAPLTDDQINGLRQQYGITSDGRGIKEFTYVRDFARAIEAAHGITEKGGPA